MSKKAQEAIEALNIAQKKISDWMYDKEELGEDTGDIDYWGNEMDTREFMVDWLETLG